MARSSTSFKPGKSGNPHGRPKGIRTLARLIDIVGDETSQETDADYRTTTIRRLWQAASTGQLDRARPLKNAEWLELVKWLVAHVDRAAMAQWDWPGPTQIRVEDEIDLAQRRAAARAAKSRIASQVTRLATSEPDELEPSQPALAEDTSIQPDLT